MFIDLFPFKTIVLCQSFYVIITVCSYVYFSSKKWTSSEWNKWLRQYKRKDIIDKDFKVNVWATMYFLMYTRIFNNYQNNFGNGAIKNYRYLNSFDLQNDSFLWVNISLIWHVL